MRMFCLAYQIHILKISAAVHSRENQTKLKLSKSRTISYRFTNID